MENRLNLPQQARIAVGLSQRRFAELLGVSRSVVERWEAGKPPTGAAVALLKIVRERPEAVLDALRDDRGGSQ